MKVSGWMWVYISIFWLATLVAVAQLAIDETKDRYEKPLFQRYSLVETSEEDRPIQAPDLRTCENALLACAGDVIILTDKLEQCESRVVPASYIRR